MSTSTGLPVRTWLPSRDRLAPPAIEKDNLRALDRAPMSTFDDMPSAVTVA